MTNHRPTNLAVVLVATLALAFAQSPPSDKLEAAVNAIGNEVNATLVECTRELGAGVETRCMRLSFGSNLQRYLDVSLVLAGYEWIAPWIADTGAPGRSFTDGTDDYFLIFTPLGNRENLIVVGRWLE